MLRKASVLNFSVATAFAAVFLSSSALAETLDLSCTPSVGYASHLTIDLISGLVKNGADYDARGWAAHIDDNEIIWNEIFDWHISHFSNHYIFDRATGRLSASETKIGGGVREILVATCLRIP
jgi:hypothetical protein